MIYFQTKEDLEFLKSFRQAFLQFVKIDVDTEGRSQDYEEIRSNYVKKIPKMKKISEQEGVSYLGSGYAAPIEGGIPFEGSVYKLVLNPPSALIDFEIKVLDAINQVEGSLEEKLENEYRQIINPIYWIKEFSILIIRLPFTILKISGFNVQKIEDHLFGKLFQLIYILALLYILIRFGIKIEDIKNFF